MNETEVIALMKSSKGSDEWGTNCDTVKAACGGYPGFWYRSIIQSGLMEEIGLSSKMTLVELS